MKKIMILLISLTFVGCDLAYDAIIEAKAKDHRLYYGDFSSVETINDATMWIFFNLEYRNEGYSDVWKNPQDTIKDGYGDCEDLALVFMSIMYTEFGIKCDFICANSKDMVEASERINRSMVSGGYVNHAMVVMDGNVYNPETGYIYGTYEQLKSEIGYIYSFDEVFNY